VADLENSAILPPQHGKQPAEPEPSQSALIQKLGSGKYKKYARFVVAALSAIPWIGGVIGAAASFSAERDQEGVNDLHRLWLQEHKEKVNELGATFGDIFSRLDSFGDDIQERIQSPEYLVLVQKCFRSWDEADTHDKKAMLKRLITNAGAIKLCPDNLIRLFMNWINQYHESHFAVIKEIYRHPGVTRGQIWDNIHGARPRENSADADLFRYLIRELSTGGVIRQARETDALGRFYKTDRSGHQRSAQRDVMESSFEDTKPYVLTELGKQFVHYVMEDVVSQLGQNTTAV
jgi:hypothetical protein